MTREAAESIVDAYGWAIELSVSKDLTETTRVKACGLCDALREYLVEILSDEGKVDE
jgi:hypothetical protein